MTGRCEKRMDKKKTLKEWLTLCLMDDGICNCQACPFFQICCEEDMETVPKAALEMVLEVLREDLSK